MWRSFRGVVEMDKEAIGWREDAFGSSRPASDGRFCRYPGDGFGVNDAFFLGGGNLECNGHKAESISL